MSITKKTLQYQANGKTYHGYFAYPEQGENLSAVLLAPEWWGLSEHVKQSAERLAKAGYAALALDVYGDGVITQEASQANEWMNAVLNDPDALPNVTAAALSAVTELDFVNADLVAAIGFCFGGKVALDMARRGQDIVAAVSFHGTLTPDSPAQADVLKAKILVEHGAEDSLIPQEDLDAFKQEMDAAGADYQVDLIEGAKHGFTNPQATENGRKNGVDLAYSAEGAAQAWNNMMELFSKVLPVKQ